MTEARGTFDVKLNPQPTDSPLGRMSIDKQESLALAVVPDSGTGELAGLSGTMTIDIKDGKHFYTFTYAIAKAP